MVITTTAGEQRPVQIGQALAGVAIREVTLTAYDTHHPMFFEWFIDIVMPRLAQ